MAEPGGGEPVQLLWLGEESARFREKTGTRVSFADGYPLLLISQASLEDLNLRSDALHQMSQFRTNLVASGTSPSRRTAGNGSASARWSFGSPSPAAAAS